MPMPTFREFEDRKEAERYALETGMPLGRRVPDRKLKRLLSPYFVGKFSPYHYREIKPRENKP